MADEPEAQAPGRASAGRLRPPPDEVVCRLREALDRVAIYFSARTRMARRGGTAIRIFWRWWTRANAAFERDGKAYVAHPELGIANDVMVYTREELERRAALLESFVRTVKRKGRVLYAA